MRFHLILTTNLTLLEPWQPALLHKQNSPSRATRPMSNSRSGAGVDNTDRRKWDKSKYEGIPSDDEDDDQRKPANWGVRRAPLKGRVEKVDIDSSVGKQRIVTSQTPLNQQAGYYCQVCDCLVKDSLNYLDHVNGKNHQRALGMSMRVERSSVDQVKERLKMMKKKSTEPVVTEDVEVRLEKRRAEEEAKKKMKKEKERMHKEEEKDPGIGNDDQIMSALGFSGFGTSKK